MLTIGRALMTNPDLLILDEATEGLAPLIAMEIWRIVKEIRRTGIATVIVDKNFAAVNALADRSVILVKGRVVFEGDRPVDMVYLSVNPAFHEITGIREPVVGRRISEVIPGFVEDNPLGALPGESGAPAECRIGDDFTALPVLTETYPPAAMMRSSRCSASWARPSSKSWRARKSRRSAARPRPKT